jgi:hypothetical protein
MQIGCSSDWLLIRLVAHPVLLTMLLKVEPVEQMVGRLAKQVLQRVVGPLVVWVQSEIQSVLVRVESASRRVGQVMPGVGPVLVGVEVRRSPQSDSGAKIEMPPVQ